MTTQADVSLSDGRTRHVYDTGEGAGTLAVCWHHGTRRMLGYAPAVDVDEGMRRTFQWLRSREPIGSESR